MRYIDRRATRPAVLVQLPGTDRLLMAARLGQPQVHVVEVSMLAEPLPETREVVGTTPLARRALHDEPASTEIAQPLHQPAIAIGNSPTCVV